MHCINNKRWIDYIIKTDINIYLDDSLLIINFSIEKYRTHLIMTTSTMYFSKTIKKIYFQKLLVI